MVISNIINSGRVRGGTIHARTLRDAHITANKEECQQKADKINQENRRGGF